MSVSKSYLDKFLNRTMLTPPRLVKLIEQVNTFKDRNDVCYVQCGVAKGGALAIIADNCHPDSQVFGFDSFSNMPDLTPEDQNEQRALLGNFDKIGNKWKGKIFASHQDVLETFKLTNVSMKNTKIIKGYVQDTLPGIVDEIDKIAVLHLDMDFYDATKYALEMLYDKVIDGGFIIIDDYNAYVGCRKAVNDFRDKNGITSEMHEVVEKIRGLKGGVAKWWVKNKNNNI